MKGSSKAQAAACDDRHGFSNPRMLVIACRCESCEGEFHSDGTNDRNALLLDLHDVPLRVHDRGDQGIRR